METIAIQGFNHPWDGMLTVKYKWLVLLETSDLPKLKGVGLFIYQFLENG